MSGNSVKIKSSILSQQFSLIEVTGPDSEVSLPHESSLGVTRQNETEGGLDKAMRLVSN